VLRAVAAFLVLLVTTTIAAPVTCAGWEASPQERRECCQRADHAGCPDQPAADSCCAAHEQARHLTPVLSSASQVFPTTPLVLPVPVLDAATVDRASATRLDVLLAKRLHGPPAPLIAPLRI
jgi:hypothetical protein